MSRLLHWEPNPIIVKELRSRMRGGRAFATLTGALILLAGCGYAIYRIALVAVGYTSTPLSPQIGQILFAGLVFIELMIIAAITPSVTAMAISGEKEKQTYEMLMATPLSPSSILWGKLVAALGYVFLLIFAAIPLASLVFVFGGVAAREMIKALIILVIVAVMFGVIGLFASALFGRSGRSTAVAYLVVVFLLFGPPIIAAGAGILSQTNPPRWMLILSPVSALASALSPSVNFQYLAGMFWMLGGAFGWIAGEPAISFTSIPRPIYHYSLPIYLLITLVLYLLASRLVRPARRWQFEWAEALVALVVVIGLLGTISVGYAATTNRYENINIVVQPTATPFPTPTPSTLELEPQTTPAPGESAPSDDPSPKGMVAPAERLSNQ
jgi:ABC-type transport system involved in multi-copper enzyme maturation permease subunit